MKFWAAWFNSMRTIIILVLLSPLAVLLLAGWDNPRLMAYGNLGTLAAFAIGFPIDWWRLQRRQARR